MNMYRNFNKVRQSIFHFMMGRMVLVVSAVLVSLMVVRGLTVVDFATYVTLLGLMLVTAMVSDAGISRVQPRFLPELYIQKQLQGLVFLSRALIVIRMLMHAMMLFAFWLLATYSEIIHLALEPSVLLSFASFAFFYALNQQTQRTMQVLLLQKVAAKITALEWVLKLLPLGYLYHGADSFSLFEVFLVQAFAVMTSFLAGQYVLWNKSRQLLAGSEVQTQQPLGQDKIFHFAWKNWLQSLLGIPWSPGAVRMLFAAVAGAVAVASLGFAYTMMQLLQRVLPSKMIVQAIEPVYIARYRETGNFVELNDMVSLVLKLNYFMLMPMLAWFALGSYAILDWVSAGKYAGSGWIIAALIFIFMLENHRMALQVLSNAVDQSILLVKSNLFAMMLLPLYVAASIYWGIYGVLLGLVAVSWVRNWFLVFHLRRRGFHYQQDWRSMIKMAGMALLSGIGMYFLQQQLNGLIVSIGSALIGLIVFYGVGLKVQFFKDKERNLINKTVGKRVFLW